MTGEPPGGAEADASGAETDASAGEPPRAETDASGAEADARGAEIERAITRLVREAPALDLGVAAELVERLRRVGSPLALSIARVVELVAEGRIAQGIALPHLAMACATLAGGLAGTLSERELEAARYEVDTLLPVPEIAGMRPGPDKDGDGDGVGDGDGDGDGVGDGVGDRTGPEDRQRGARRRAPDVRIPDVPVGALTRGPRRRT